MFKNNFWRIAKNWFLEGISETSWSFYWRNSWKSCKKLKKNAWSSPVGITKETVQSELQTKAVNFGEEYLNESLGNKKLIRRPWISVELTTYQNLRMRSCIWSDNREGTSLRQHVAKTSSLGALMSDCILISFCLYYWLTIWLWKSICCLKTEYHYHLCNEYTF